MTEYASPMTRLLTLQNILTEKRDEDPEFADKMLSLLEAYIKREKARWDTYPCKWHYKPKFIFRRHYFVMPNFQNAGPLRRYTFRTIKEFNADYKKRGFNGWAGVLDGKDTTHFRKSPKKQEFGWGQTPLKGEKDDKR